MKYTLLLCERSRKIVGSRKIVVPREREKKNDAQGKHAKNQQPEGSHRHHQ